jgi:hypothetical protein
MLKILNWLTVSDLFRVLLHHGEQQSWGHSGVHLGAEGDIICLRRDFPFKGEHFFL